MKKKRIYRYFAALACLVLLFPCGRLSAQEIGLELQLGGQEIQIKSSGKYIVGAESSSNKWKDYDPGKVIHIYMSNHNPVTRTSGGSINIVNPENGSTTSSVETIISEWNGSGREFASGHVHIIGDAVTTLHMLIEDCVSSYQDYNNGRLSGGLGFEPTVDGAKLEVRLKGDNRFGNVAYSTRDFMNCQLIFTSAAGDGNTSGTMTVADVNYSTHSHSNIYDGCYNNWYNSVIGGADNPDVQNSRGIVIKGGTIYAGALVRDNCSAIGGGGNGVGTVTITGGQVTAVTSSTGTAIGGGIGWTDNGGESTVTITGGDVYAYNHGFVHSYDGAARFVPATAIGGGSSFVNSSYASTVNISGGNIYAQSVGGVAIGGGGSGMGDAGSATVNISGGNIKASNMAGNVTPLTGGSPVSIPAGTSIGGGTGGLGVDAGKIGNGGSATVKVSGSAKLIAGSIGGGATNSTMGGVIGYADITITGNPLIQGQFMMRKSSQGCSFTMNGGTIDNSQDNSSHYVFKQDNGGALSMIDEDATAIITAGSIYGCNARGKGGAIYMQGGKFHMTGGTIGSSAKPNKAASDGGGVYIDIADNPAKKSEFKMESASEGSKCSIIYNQSGGDGGAVYVADGTVTVKKGIIAHNTANGNGGGAYVASGTVSVADGDISSNKAITGNGGGVYTTSNVDVTGTSKINDNTSALSGGGVYVQAVPGQDVVVNITSSSTACEINGNTANGSHASTCGGGGLYLSSGTVNLTNATVDKNKAVDGLGGGIYVGSGTINVQSGSSSNNEAYDGGGLYAGGGTISFNRGGKISHNTVTHNGGGVFGSCANITFEGEHGDVSVKEYAEISFNTAMNGAGIYMTRGANMSVTAALVNGNEAVVVNKDADDKPTPAIPLSAFWYYTKDPGSNNKQYLQGIGGGVYLDSGIDDSHKTTLEFVTTNLVSLGIYSNRAAIAADDIFANGDWTQVIIPAVDDMEFEAFGGRPTGWYEDYMTNDVSYASGTYENNRNGATGIRYRTAYQSGQNMFKVDNQKASDTGRYICLALGDPFSSLVIKVTGLKKGESAVYTCTKEGDDKPTYYVIITGTSDSGEEVSRIINNVPIGNWSVEQTDWSWAYNVTSAKIQTGMVGVDAVELPTMRFSNTVNTAASVHGESIKNNVFSTVVTAVDIVTVTPRENKGANNKNIDL